VARLILVLIFLLGINALHAQELTALEPAPKPSELTAIAPAEASFQWKRALVETYMFVAIEQGFRLVDDAKVRRQLEGPFVRDYFASLGNIGGWSDGDGPVANYVGHPLAGSIVGYIQVRHDPRYRTSQFGATSQYWKSRMRAMSFSAAYSLAFEIGPISQASIGNIQMDPRKRGVVDWVVTPTLGTAWMVTEDFLDKHVVRGLERRTKNRPLLAVTRALLNPARSLSNLVGRRLPWHRDDRPGLNSLRVPPVP
jgi:hypothetical protein